MSEQTALAYRGIDPWIFVDFDTSQKTSQYEKAIAVTRQVVGVQGQLFLDLCRKLFNKYNPSVFADSSSAKIPKKIHQIWLGGQVPECFLAYMESWKRYHPDWEYYLWTDKEAESFAFYNQEYYDSIDNYGVKSDLLKWEIIYRHGGVYIDTDYECLKPLDGLDHYDFYTALQPLDSQFVQLGAALFAAVPGHPILKQCIETVKDDWHHNGAPQKTGPVHFTRSFYATAGRRGRADIAFPAGYFYPQGVTDRGLNYEQWLEQGAYAIHHWAKSWMPAKFRKQEFKKIDNEESSRSWNN